METSARRHALTVASIPSMRTASRSAHRIRTRWASITLCLAVLSTGLAATPVRAQAGPEIDGGARLVFELVDDPDIARLPKASPIWTGAAPVSPVLGPIVEGDDGIVVLAGCPDERCTHVLRSVDGEAWDAVLEALPVYPQGLAWSDSGFLALQGDGGVYRSDDGLDWEAVKLEGSARARKGFRDVDVDTIAAGPNGYVGLGCLYCDRAVAMWSEDGRTWTRDEQLGMHAPLMAAASSGSTLVAITDPNTSVEDDLAVAMVDGRWQDLDLPLPDLDGGGYAYARDIAADPAGGFIILGTRETAKGSTTPFVLTSDDGLTWGLETIVLDLGAGPISAEPISVAVGPEATAVALSPSGRRARAAGLDGTSVVAWSADGGAWQVTELPVPPDASGHVEVYGGLLATADGRIIALGDIYKDRGRLPAIWVGRLTNDDAESTAGPVETHDAPSPSPSRRAVEQELLGTVGLSSCVPYRARGDFDPFDFGAVAAVRCDAPSPGLSQLAAFRFPDTGSLEDYWSDRVDSIESPLPRRSSACQDGEPGLTQWEGGSIACYVSPTSGQAQIRWVDLDTNTYWLAGADDRDLARLQRWWREERP